jgi:hypothetical protein
MELLKNRLLADHLENKLRIRVVSQPSTKKPPHRNRAGNGMSESLFMSLPSQLFEIKNKKNRPTGILPVKRPLSSSLFPQTLH